MEDHDGHHHHSHHKQGSDIVSNISNSNQSLKPLSDATLHHHDDNVTFHTDHQMAMHFHASSSATVLFSVWTVSSSLGMVISCLIIIIMGILYEGLKVLREHLLMGSGKCCSNKNNAKVPIATVTFENDNIEVKDVPNCCEKSDTHYTETSAPHKQQMRHTSHLIQTILHGVQVFHSYCLMLIFMTYNVWLCASVVIGAILGYFLFAWKRHKCNSCVPNSKYTLNDHCH